MSTGYYAVPSRARTPIALLLALFASLVASAAPPPPTPVAIPAARITGRIDDFQRLELKGQVHRAIADSVDLGAADPSLPADRIVMVLGATPSQETDLTDFLRRAQTPGSLDYHRWLTPEAFGQRFGVAPADLAVIRTWLQSKGFQLGAPTAGRRSIVFSGTVGQLNDAFATRMHRYRWHGERHLANSTNPTIPQAFSAVVRGFTSLHDFRLQPQLHRGAPRPQANLGGNFHAMAPGDFATIYDLASTYAKGITGSGRTIAVIGRSDVQNADLNNFRSMFGLSATLPTVVLAGADPGLVADDQTESDLDLEWAAGVAPGATVRFVTAKSTNTTDGITLSSQFAVEQNLADVITVSYSGCEAPSDVSAGTTFFNQLWQQAAAQGMSVFVSSGDSGAAGCDAPASTSATHGPGINALCSSPYATCVGGTEFVADAATPTSYWAAANTPGTFASALQYIGEAAWNQSGTVAGGSDLWSSGGGASIYYAKPAWQLSTGVPSDGVRDVPDVSLNASSLHDPYLIYSSEGNSGPTLESIGGTSASTPSMAAIAALVAQQQNGRVGSFAPVLYGLSDLQVNGGATVFHRITSGNNTVPGQAGFAGTSSDPTYNEATGLGSVDAGLLVAHWSDFRGPASGLSPANAVFPATRSVGSATLLLPSSTAWSASVSSGAAAWLTVAPTHGTGSAPLTYSAEGNLTAVARTGTLSIDGQTLTVTQAATGGASAQLNLSASALSFGTDMVGVGTQKTVLVSNTGGTNLTLGAIVITGAAQADYTDTGTCSAGLLLPPGASCVLQVSFDPTTAGGRAATLQIGSASVALSGTGMEGPPTDGPLPLWSYVLMAVLILAIGSVRRARASAADTLLP